MEHPDAATLRASMRPSFAPDPPGLEASIAPPSPAPEPGRFISVAAKIAVATVALLAGVSCGIYLMLTAHQRETQLAAKADGSMVIVETTAFTVNASIMFDDPEGVAEALDNLGKSEGVLHAAVWTGTEGQDPPFAEFRREGFEGPGARPGPTGQATVSVFEDSLHVSRGIVDLEGANIGQVAVAFSLARENAAFTELKGDVVRAAVAVATLAVGRVPISASAAEKSSRPSPRTSR